MCIRDRISSERSTVHSNIYFPDYVVVVDETLLSAVDVTAGLKKEGAIVINSSKSPAELRPLLPPEGPVLVLGVGNRRVTADALGPRTVQKVFVTMGPRTVPVQGIRPVAAVAPGVSAATGLSLQQLAGALVRELRPAALLCVDSLCSAEPERLGRTLQFSDTGLHPAQPDHLSLIHI